MPKVTFVKKAQKDVAGTNIKKGESYYWWKFRFGGKRFSKTPPKRSQLTQSAFLSQLWELEERIGEFSCDNKDDFDSFKEEIKSEVEEMRDQCQENLDNMPEQLHESDSGSTLQERIDCLECWIVDIENVECYYDEDDIKKEKETELEREENETDGEYQERIQEAVNESIQEVVDAAVSELQELSSGL